MRNPSIAKPLWGTLSFKPLIPRLHVSLSRPVTLPKRPLHTSFNVYPISRRTTPFSLASPSQRPSYRSMQGDTLKLPETTRRHYLEIALLFATVVGLVGYDVYYVMYQHEPKPKKLSPSNFRQFKLREVIPLNHDSSLYRFGCDLRDVDSTTNPAPSHVIVKDDTCQIARPYTPVTFAKSHFDLIVKRYPDGIVSGFLAGLDVGSYVEIRGPIQTLPVPYQANVVDELGMIAGGTGITPAYQLIKQILRNKNDHTKISLIYANKSEEDILLRSELEVLSVGHPDRLKVYFVIEKEPASKDWLEGLGYINEKMVKENLPNPILGDKAAVLVSGPDGMVRHVAGSKAADDSQGPLSGVLREAGFEQSQVFKL